MPIILSMDGSRNIPLFAILSVIYSVAGTYIHVPKGCSHFAKDVIDPSILHNFGLHHFNFTLFPTINPNLLYTLDLHNLHLPKIPDIGKKSAPISPRFILPAGFAETLKTSLDNINAAYKNAIPASKEIQNSCRVNLTTASTNDIAFLRALRQKYQLCYVCDGISITNCPTIGICGNGTQCYHGYNPDFHGTQAFYLSLWNRHVAAFGCCDPKTDSHCAHAQTYRTHLKNPKITVNFTIAPCHAPVCDGGSASDVIGALHKIYYVNGGWTSWTHWSTCTNCDRNGRQSRTRSCSNPRPKYGGKTCIGSRTDTRTCHIPCHKPEDGGWSHWTAYSACSVSCCTGHKTRTRKCNHPSPAYGGSKCSGISSQTVNCTNSCKGDAHWSVWTQWGHCSASCAGGSKTRSRSCLNQSNCTGPCKGYTTYKTACNTKPCPVWAAWSSGACSVTCGTGKRTFIRHCSSGRDTDCSGSASKTESCHDKDCPVDGAWDGWHSWSHCSTTCGQGEKKRSRSCNSPAPKNGGKDCHGNSVETTSCQVKHCPRDGMWGQWSSYSACSVSCCQGHKTRTRKCDHPTPLFGGITCQGVSKDTANCENPCKGDAHWSGWAHWSTCSTSCENGTMTRTRTCANMSQCTGPCPGGTKESSTCNLGTCPVWSSWFYGPCSVTCGTGSKQGMRRCSTGHEEDCPGKSFTTTTCQAQPCPADGSWGDWQNWGSCSSSCGDGTWARKRVCDNPVPAHGGQTCPGDKTETGHCKVMDCPHWGAFYEGGPCSVTCGNGVVQLQRNCSTGNNRDCTGSAYDEKPCEKQACPT